MDEVNVAIVGAGVVGLAIAAELSETIKDIIVLEQRKIALIVGPGAAMPMMAKVAGWAGPYANGNGDNGTVTYGGAYVSHGPAVWDFHSVPPTVDTGCGRYVAVNRCGIPGRFTCGLPILTPNECGCEPY